jgi:hypothetical protein
VIGFLCSEGIKSGEIYERIIVRSCNNYTSRNEVYERVQRYSGRRTSVCDNARSVRTSTVTCTEVKEQIDQSIRDNRRMNTDETSCEMSISLSGYLCY